MGFFILSRGGGEKDESRRDFGGKGEGAGEQVSLFYEGREITNVEMLRVSRRLARTLKDLGSSGGPGHPADAQLPEVIQGFGAAWRIGAVVVPINYLVGRRKPLTSTRTRARRW